MPKTKICIKIRRTNLEASFLLALLSEAVEKVIDAHAKHMIDNKWVEVRAAGGVGRNG